MRKLFSNTIEKLAVSNDDIIFITGDLGFNAFENLRDAIGERFINAGVAEQSMVSMAAGMAYKGYKVFCYSIAPFIVYRCLEQFRNDVCFHKLPVFLVGNGGGYGYGIMGSTHHALEDIACMGSMMNNKCWVPAFSDDLEPIVETVITNGTPAYLRLGTGKPAPAIQERCGSFNKVAGGSNACGTIVALGPIVNNVLEAINEGHMKDRFDLFTAVTLPVNLPQELEVSIVQTGKLLVVEEHVRAGGLAQQLSLELFERKIPLRELIALNAQGYPGGVYGDQLFHQRQSGLDSGHISSVLQRFV